MSTPNRTANRPWVPGTWEESDLGLTRTLSVPMVGGMNEAINTVHTMTMRDGTVVTTTWHNTKAVAKARIAAPTSATFRKVFPGGCLGAYRAVTWEAK